MTKAAPGLGIDSKSAFQTHIYSALSGHFDMTDEFIPFVVYSLLDKLMVVPISNRVESARLVAINA